ncbi:MAG: MBL fold metallo-hydrolase [Candidatus Eisenbacteria bacterium]|nr:MBL fold metallo-hydrolase [Candidatus Eisenbacteria bacterium]
MSPGPGVQCFPVGPFQSNTYIVSGGGRALVVDPGDEPRRIQEAVAAQGLAVEAILLTHGHLDHVGAVAELERAFGVDTHLHPADRVFIERLAETCERYGLEPYEPPGRLRDLVQGQRFTAGTLELRAAETPGHSPGGVVFVGPGFALVGDLVFAGSVGRHDLPGGDARALARSIRREILSLPGPTVLHPGHGPATTVDAERADNPYLAPGALPEEP